MGRAFSDHYDFMYRDRKRSFRASGTRSCFIVTGSGIITNISVDYRFFPDTETFSLRNVSRYIGNAVPPLLGEVIAESIKRHLKTYKEKLSGSYPSDVDKAKVTVGAIG